MQLGMNHRVDNSLLPSLHIWSTILYSLNITRIISILNLNIFNLIGLITSFKPLFYTVLKVELRLTLNMFNIRADVIHKAVEIPIPEGKGWKRENMQKTPDFLINK